MVVEGGGGQQAASQPVRPVGQTFVFRVPGRHPGGPAAAIGILQNKETAVHGGDEKRVVGALPLLLFDSPDAATHVVAFHLALQAPLVPESQLFVIAA